MLKLLATLLILAATPPAGFGGPRVAGGGKVTIGVIVPLSGKAASIGHAVKNGIELAWDELPEEIRERLRLRFEDDGSETKNAIAAYQKLLLEPSDVIISVFSNAGHALAPLAEHDRVVHVALALDSRIGLGRKYSFTLWSRLDDLAEAAVAEALRRGYRRVGVVATSHEGNLAQLNALRKAAIGKLGLFEQAELLPGETDFRPAVSRLKSIAGLDAIANLLHPAHMGIFVRTARQLNLLLPQFALANFEDRGVVRDAAGALQDQWYVAAEYSSEFLATYRRRFPETSIYGAAHAHDALLLAASALRSGGGKENVVTFLNTVRDFNGALQGLNADGKNSFEMSLTIKVVGHDGLE